MNSIWAYSPSLPPPHRDMWECVVCLEATLFAVRTPEEVNIVASQQSHRSGLYNKMTVSSWQVILSRTSSKVKKEFSWSFVDHWMDLQGPPPQTAAVNVCVLALSALMWIWLHSWINGTESESKWLIASPCKSRIEAAAIIIQPIQMREKMRMLLLLLIIRWWCDWNLSLNACFPLRD